MSEQRQQGWMMLAVLAIMFASIASWYLGYYMGMSDTIEGKKGYICVSKTK